MSNMVYKKAAEIYESGRLGLVTLIEAHTDREFPFRRMGVSGRAGCKRGDD